MTNPPLNYIFFLRHIGITLSIPNGVATMGAVGRGEYASAECTKMEKKMESPPRLGLGTINIAPFVE